MSTNQEQTLTKVASLALSTFKPLAPSISGSGTERVRLILRVLPREVWLISFSPTGLGHLDRAAQTAADKYQQVGETEVLPIMDDAALWCSDYIDFRLGKYWNERIESRDLARDELEVAVSGAKRVKRSVKKVESMFARFPDLEQRIINGALTGERLKMK